MINEKLNRLQNALSKAEEDFNALIQKGKLMQLPTQKRKIEAIKKLIEQEESYSPQPLSKYLTKQEVFEYNIPIKIIEMHLASDFLADCAACLKETLHKLNLDNCTLYPYVDEIKRLSERFAGMVCKTELSGLSDFMIFNDEYIENAHKLTTEYISKHLKITD